jgi:hypothetical protein
MVNNSTNINIGGICDHQWLEVIVPFVDIGGIVHITI